MPTHNNLYSINDEKHQIQDSNDRKVVLLMGMGLNGISAEGWIPPAETKIQAEEMIEDVWTLLESVDTLIIGRVTFQMWEKYWPSRALIQGESASDNLRQVLRFNIHTQYKYKSNYDTNTK